VLQVLYQDLLVRREIQVYKDLLVHREILAQPDHKASLVRLVLQDRRVLALLVLLVLLQTFLGQLDHKGQLAHKD
jgi:hypothetical protein